MIGRCHCETHRRYSDYGGRGISVCERWRESVVNFIIDMGRCPSSDHQLERKNNDGNYEPDNCLWATRKEQGRNKRNNVILTHDNRSQPMSAWAEEKNIPYSTLRQRIMVKLWPVDRALMTPVRVMNGPLKRSSAKRIADSEIHIEPGGIVTVRQ